MRASVVPFALLLVVAPFFASAPAADAHGLPPEEIGGSCFGVHWNEIDLEEGDLPHYHAHFYCF